MDDQLANQAPPPHVLDALGASEPPQRVLGGQGQTWRSGTLALKPVSNTVEAEWLGDLLDGLPEVAFQVARPE